MHFHPTMITIVLIVRSRKSLRIRSSRYGKIYWIVLQMTPSSATFSGFSPSDCFLFQKNSHFEDHDKFHYLEGVHPCIHPWILFTGRSGNILYTKTFTVILRLFRSEHFSSNLVHKWNNCSYSVTSLNRSYLRHSLKVVLTP